MPKPGKKRPKRKAKGWPLSIDRSVKTPDLVAAPAVERGTTSKLLVFLGLWTVFCLVTLTFSNFSWMLPGLAKKVPFQGSVHTSLVLLMMMVGAVYFIPKKMGSSEISPKAAGVLLASILGLAAFLCFYRFDIPMANYSVDTAFNIAHIRHIVDLSNYQGVLTPTYGIWPLWELTAIILWYLFPGTSSLAIQRFSNGLLDLAAIWLLYLAGKKVGGRRMGLFAAALAAVSKPLIVKVVAGFGYSAMTFGMSLALLCTLRLFEKKGLIDFLAWGGSVGFLAYTCTPFQPFIPYFVFTTFVLLLFQKEGEWPGIPVWISFAVLLVYFLYCNNAFSNTHWIDVLRNSGAGWKWVLSASVFVPGGLYFIKAYREKIGTRWAGWMAGAWLCAWISSPFLANEQFLSIIKMHALVNGSGFLSWSYLSSSIRSVGTTFQSLFWIGGDRADMAPAADAYFSYSEDILIALGLAFGLGKPNRKILFLILTAAAATAPHFFSSETHSGRLIACPPPFLLVGAYGLNELFNRFLDLKFRKGLRLLAYVGLIFFWVWSARMVFERIYSQWALKPVRLTAVRDQVIQDVDHGFQVYLPSDFSDGDLGVLYEGHPVHLFRQSNPIYLGSDEVPADRVVIIEAGSPEKALFEKAFPKAVWSDVRNSDQDPARSTVAYRCEITPEGFQNPQQKIFVVHRVPAPYWRRTYTGTNSGFSFGFLNWDDKTANVNDPTPPQVYLDYAGVRYEGLIHMAHAGEYVFHCKAVNRTEVFVDGKRLFDLSFFRTGNYMAPGADEQKTIVLGQGDHRVQVTTCFQRFFGPPDISIGSKGSPGPGRSLWSSFDF